MPRLEQEAVAANTALARTRALQTSLYPQGPLASQRFGAKELRTQNLSRLKPQEVLDWLMTSNNVFQAVYLATPNDVYACQPAQLQQPAAHRSARAGSVAPAQQGFDFTWPRSHVCEYSQLLDSLHQMFDVVRSREQALRDANEQLEERIQERTHALSDTNEEMSVSIEVHSTPGQGSGFILDLPRIAPGAPPGAPS